MPYTPRTPPPFEDSELRRALDFLSEELMAIAKEFSDTIALELRPTNVEPTRPRNGMIVYADGTNWNPGAGGAGVYARVGGAWVKLH